MYEAKEGHNHFWTPRRELYRGQTALNRLRCTNCYLDGNPKCVAELSMEIAIESAVCCLMSAPKEGTVAKLPPKPVRILLGVWLLLCILPVFVAMFGYNFVPSTEWISTTSRPGLAAGLSSAALISWGVLKARPTPRQAR